MFDNIGRKIKIFAIVIFVLEMLVGIIAGFAFGINTDWKNPLRAILIIVTSPFLAWISASVLYGFGQLVENSDKLVNNSNKLVHACDKKMNYEGNHTSTQTSSTNERKFRYCDKCGKMISGEICPYCG